MKHFLLIIGVIICSKCSQAQNLTPFPPSYDSIKMLISDSSSKYYYPTLIDRCNKMDTTLTDIDYRYLYYGYTFQPQYQPYWRSPYEEKLVKYYAKEKFKQRDYDEVIRLATLSLKEFPFDLRQMNFLAYVYELKNDMITANRLRYKFGMIISAIFSTGDGKTCSHGFHVINTSHEYVILNMFRFEFKSQMLTTDYCDYMEVKRDERGIDGIYFNINRLWNVNMENMKNSKN
jgi:hypothetical protein